MKKAERDSKIKDLQEDAKDLQARLGFVTMQLDRLADEKVRIKHALEAGEAKFAALQQSPVDPEDAA